MALPVAYRCPVSASEARTASPRVARSGGAPVKAPEWGGEDPLLRGIQSPVLVVSAKAGLGNYSAGAELSRRISVTHPVNHVPIEHLIADSLVRSDFDRHRWICLNAPWLLHLLNGLPWSYQLKYLRESWVERPEARVLEERIGSYGARTIIAVNSRAALWLGLLRRRGRLSAALWAVLTDYAVSMGWRYQLWTEVERVLGPVPPEDVPRDFRHKYHRIEIPVREAFRKIAAAPGDVDQVLLCGGAWGLGRLAEVSAELARHLPSVRQHVACGDNPTLLLKMRSLEAQHRTIRAYPHVEDLDSILERCASVITKPGGLTLAEAHAAKRTIFLMDGLPGVEQQNRAFALKHMDARGYSLASFGEWIAKRRAQGGAREDG